MTDIDLYCMCLHEHHLSNIKKLDYIPVGLGANKFSKEWLKDNTGQNISEKNPNYGEYTFYYWFWKNILPNFEKSFCQLMAPDMRSLHSASSHPGWRGECAVEGQHPVPLQTTRKCICYRCFTFVLKMTIFQNINFS